MPSPLPPVRLALTGVCPPAQAYAAAWLLRRQPAAAWLLVREDGAEADAFGESAGDQGGGDPFLLEFNDRPGDEIPVLRGGGRERPAETKLGHQLGGDTAKSFRLIQGPASSVLFTVGLFMPMDCQAIFERQTVKRRVIVTRGKIPS